MLCTEILKCHFYPRNDKPSPKWKPSLEHRMFLIEIVVLAERHAPVLLRTGQWYAWNLRQYFVALCWSDIIYTVSVCFMSTNLLYTVFLWGCEHSYPSNLTAGASPPPGGSAGTWAIVTMAGRYVADPAWRADWVSKTHGPLVYRQGWRSTGWCACSRSCDVYYLRCASGQCGCLVAVNW